MGSWPFTDIMCLLLRLLRKFSIIKSFSVDDNDRINLVFHWNVGFPFMLVS